MDVASEFFKGQRYFAEFIAPDWYLPAIDWIRILWGIDLLLLVSGCGNF